MKFQVSSHQLWLCSLVCVDLVGNPEDGFSCEGAQRLDEGLKFHQKDWTSRELGPFNCDAVFSKTKVFLSVTILNF